MVILCTNYVGFISTQGQPASYEKCCTFKTLMTSNGSISDNWYHVKEQKPYIIGFLKQKQLKPFEAFMEKYSKEYYFHIISYESQTLINTFPTFKYNVSRQKSNKSKAKLKDEEWDYYTIIWEDTNFDANGVFTSLENIQTIFKNTVEVEIAGAKYRQGSCEKLLLEFFKSEEFQERVNETNNCT